MEPAARAVLSVPAAQEAAALAVRAEPVVSAVSVGLKPVVRFRLVYFQLDSFDRPYSFD